MDKLDIIIIILFSLLFFLIGVLVCSIFYRLSENPISILDPEESNYTKNEINYTESFTVEEYTKNLTKYVKTFYIYNVTDDWLNLTEKELKERGGDCHDWAIYYENKAKEDGFISYSFHIKEHRFAVIQDKKDLSNFCIVNMRNYRCF